MYISIQFYHIVDFCQTLLNNNINLSISPQNNNYLLKFPLIQTFWCIVSIILVVETFIKTKQAL